ncbi:hydrogenase maturation protease [Methylomonas methanica]|nr:hydrogenase maturation protease [Methylomonas methanica]
MRHIICFGNPLHGDDGFGTAVYQRLAELPLPDNLRLFDAGTAGLAALTLFQGCDEVCIVDACQSGGEAGRLSRLLPETVMAEVTPAGHGVGVGYLLQALAALPEPMPQIQIIAAEADAVGVFRPGLSAAVAKAVDEAVALLSPYFFCDAA